jgi:hypothetical protein
MRAGRKNMKGEKKKEVQKKGKGKREKGNYLPQVNRLGNVVS